VTTVSEFLVEVYLSRGAASAARPRLEEVVSATEELTREGEPVRFLHSIFVPEDETGFYLFEAPSDRAACEAASRSGLLINRVVQVEWEGGAR